MPLPFLLAGAAVIARILKLAKGGETLSNNSKSQ